MDVLSKANYLKIPPEYRCVTSVYPIWDKIDSPPNNLKLYHLHPNLVGEDKRCDLCYNCDIGLRSGDQAKLYGFCLAKGFDYGDIRRLQNSSEDFKKRFRDLSLGESLALSQNRPYAVMVQVSGTSIQKLQSHYITFPIKSHEEISKSPIFTNGSEYISNRVKISIRIG